MSIPQVTNFTVLENGEPSDNLINGTELLQVGLTCDQRFKTFICRSTFQDEEYGINEGRLLHYYFNEQGYPANTQYPSINSYFTIDSSLLDSGDGTYRIGLYVQNMQDEWNVYYNFLTVECEQVYTADGYKFCAASRGLAFPSPQGVVPYTGNEQSPVWLGFDSTKMRMTGQKSGRAIGEYRVWVEPLDEYFWQDGGNYSMTLYWNIGLPAGYRECQWIQSDGRQYIDTNVGDGYGNSVKAKFEIVNNSAGFLYGSQLYDSKPYNGIESNDTFYHNYTKFQFTPAQEINIEQTASGTEMTTRINEQHFTSSIVSNTLPSMYIFAIRNNSGGLSLRTGTTRCYGFTISNGFSKYFDAVPAIDNNGIPGLYDKVSSTMFYNLGQGQFTYKLK